MLVHLYRRQWRCTARHGPGKKTPPTFPIRSAPRFKTRPLLVSSQALLRPRLARISLRMCFSVGEFRTAEKSLSDAVGSRPPASCPCPCFDWRDSTVIPLLPERDVSMVMGRRRTFMIVERNGVRGAVQQIHPMCLRVLREARFDSLSQVT